MGKWEQGLAHTSIADARSSLDCAFRNRTLTAVQLDEVEQAEQAHGNPRAAFLQMLAYFRRRLARAEAKAAAAAEAVHAPQVPARSAGRPARASTELERCEAAWSTAEPSDAVAAAAALPELAALIQAEVGQWQDIERQAAFRAIRLGVLLLKAREDCPHGQWIPWVKSSVPFTRMHVWRLCRTAEVFMEQKQVALERAYAEIAPRALAANGLPEQADPASPVVQLAFDFVGGRSFRELWEAIGANGGHGGEINAGGRLGLAKGMPPAEADEYRRAKALAYWSRLAKRLRHEKSWMLLERQAMEGVAGVLRNLAGDIDHYLRTTG